jgi:DoxX-like family
MLDEHQMEISKSAKRAGWAISALFIAFMIFDGGIKLVPLQVVVDTLAQLGLPTSEAFARGLGMLALIGTALYAFPRTAVLGAVMMTGYLGGAIATQLRVGAPFFSHVLFGAYLGLLMWGGLWLRSPRVRQFLSNE